LTSYQFINIGDVLCSVKAGREQTDLLSGDCIRYRKKSAPGGDKEVAITSKNALLLFERDLIPSTLTGKDQERD